MEIARRLVRELFPSRCIVCKHTIIRPARGQDIEICAECYKALPHNNRCCSHCALPLADDIESAVLCGRCINNPPSFDYAYSLFRYEDEIIDLVHQLKFAEKISYARSIGELMLSACLEELMPEQGRPDCIIPVPLHSKRLKKRGYNQSTEISRVLVKKTGIPVVHDVVIRQRSTLTQTGLRSRERQKNIKDAFMVKRNFNLDHALIVDDVVTTGATVNELAKVLKQNGVKRVGVFSISRAPLK